MAEGDASDEFQADLDELDGSGAAPSLSEAFPSGGDDSGE
jgi:hypothetical protein